MNIDDIRKEFIKYVKNFDLKNPNIMHKFHHSFRVMEFAIEIAESEKLSQEDITLASIIGLLHDIGRFEQWTKYETYVDANSIDHGDLGADILKDFLKDIIEDEEIREIIIIAVRNHNKYAIEDNLTKRQLLMSKIIKDADKIDIMKEQGNKLTKEIEEINPKILEFFDTHKLVTNQLVINEADSIFRLMSFIYDFYFKYTYHYVTENKIIENKINLLEIYANKDLSDLQNKILNYMKDRC